MGVLTHADSVKRRRTRNGCLTCRDRHLKCDETLPICNNCFKSKRECIRGVRLKFLNTSVHDIPVTLPDVERNAAGYFMDQSITTASRYQDGLQEYSRYMHLHLPEDLQKALIDFDRYNDVSLALESPQSRRPKFRRSVDSKLSSANFKNLLADFLKFENSDPLQLASLLDPPLLAQFDYIGPPSDLQSYLGDTKIHKAKNSIKSFDIHTEAPDYYIYDSDEDQATMSDSSLLKEDSKMEVLSTGVEVQLLDSYFDTCRWFLNSVTDTAVSDYWLNTIFSDESIKNIPNFKILLSSSGVLIANSFSETDGQQITYNEEKLRNLIILNTETKFDYMEKDPNFETQIWLLTVMIASHYSKLCKDKSSPDQIVSYIELFNSIYVQKSDTTPPFNDTLMCCLGPVYVIDLFNSIMYNQPPVLDPFSLEKFLTNKTTEYEFHAVHDLNKLKFESSFEYNEAYDYDSDDSDDDIVMGNTTSIEDVSMMSNSKVTKKCEPKFTDSSYFISLLDMLGRLNYLSKKSDTKVSDWNLILEELVFYEQNLPFIFSPLSVGPLKTQAAQGLATMGLSEEVPLTEFAGDAPFPLIKFANEMGLLIHIVHHSIYIMSAKNATDSFKSFLQLSREHAQFRIVEWYNETIPDENDSPEREILHMARRVISFFLSSSMILENNSANIWSYYGWCFELAKEFLTPQDHELLKKRLAT